MNSSAAPRDRIIAAATAEFAQHGIAGARIDRIARAARTSKERLYAYFRSKEDLYAAVVAQELTAIAEATRLDPTDLPGYAGRVHDYFLAHPDRFRLMNWGRLELDPSRIDQDDPLQASIRYKTEQIRRAQAAGHLSSEWDAADILTIVSQLAISWADEADVIPPNAKDGATVHARRRAVIVGAVERLFPTNPSTLES